MFKRSIIGQSILCALLAPAYASAYVEVSGTLKNETAFFVNDGQTIGAAEHSLDNSDSHDAGDLMKFENSARFFFNGDLGEDSTWHGELNLIYDTEGVNADYKGHQNYSQHDWLRELYIDTRLEDWYLRLGKQQVVWGTADGIKLLDIINPTDYREWTQNTMADARIPLWMINAETDVGASGNVQFIVSQSEPNRIPGLNADGDKGHAFIMQGVDTITGDVNGFLNIIPNLTDVATSFSMAAGGGLFQMPDGMGGVNAIMSGLGDWGGGPGQMTMPGGLLPFGTLMSVEGFAGVRWDTSNDGALMGMNPVLNQQQRAGDSVQNIMNPETGATNGFTMLNAIAQQGLMGMGMMGPPAADPYANQSATNLLDEQGSPWSFAAPTEATVAWDIKNPSSAFEYMPNASFATFNNSSGNQFLIGALQAQGMDPAQVLDLSKLHGPARSEYVVDYPDSAEPNFGVRYRSYLDNGLNFSLNYYYGYDANPSVSLSCRDAVTGEPLQHKLVRPGQPPMAPDMSTGLMMPNPNYNPAYTSYAPQNGAKEVSEAEVGNTFDGTMGIAYNSAGQYYGAYNPMTGGLAASLQNPDAGHSPNGIVMTFTETLERSQNLGASFDYALDTDFAPIVLRGEFLYKTDEHQPVIDKRLLGIGYLPDSMTSVEHDVFKYVLGADVNVLTNLMVSGQFIQFRNLDYVDEQRTCTTQLGTTFDCSRYTADMATLHLENGMQKAKENEEFYSLFFSKPFGPSQEHRWNNITMYEEDDGWWNRFDVEYSFSDELVGAFELNYYWGNENTMFGQFEDSSNVQVGIRYLF